MAGNDAKDSDAIDAGVRPGCMISVVLAGVASLRFRILMKRRLFQYFDDCAKASEGQMM
jgi:hypothetical protein